MKARNKESEQQAGVPHGMRRMRRTQKGQASSIVRILIADDSCTLRDALVEYLAGLPHIEVVGLAADGEQAVTLAASLRPDLVLMDLQMPRLNGLEATRKIRAGFPEVYVIVMTLYDGAEWQTASAEAGAHRFILKDHLNDELHGALAQLFSGHDRAEGARA